ncbi:NACHT domain-containing protein [Nocardiopsis sp. NPDC006938]|uniref:NACHT domain-containing protein n=1 Tax=Nocardiopsis sp. NPDC006938 TaxID=3364337 RepID=UPI0036C94EE5
MDRTTNVLGIGETSFEGTSDNIDALADRFRALPRQRLAILGGPGSGKTTLAMQLLLRLLVDWTREKEGPVPVLVSMAGWDTDEHPTLASWLTHRLDQDIPFLRASALGKKTAHHLATRGALLPVLDGLDELPEGSRSAVVSALNRSLGDGPLILASRYSEFAASVAEAGDVLASTAVVMPRELHPDDAAKYLEKCLRTRHQQQKWEAVLAHLRSPRVSRELRSSLRLITATPLGLWLVRSVYLDSGADPAPLLGSERFPTREVLEAALLDWIIEAVIKTYGEQKNENGSLDLPFMDREGYDSGKVRDRLAYLAHMLSRTSAKGELSATRNLAWWELGPRVFPGGRTWRERVSFRIFLGGLLGLSGFLFGMIFFAFVGGIHSGLRSALMGGLFGGFILGSANALLNTVDRKEYLLWSAKGPGYANLELTGRLRGLVRHLMRSMVRSGVVAFLLYGSLLGFVALQEGGAGAGIIVGIFGGLFAVFCIVPTLGFVGGIFDWIQNSSLEGKVNSPVSSWREDRSLNLVRGVVWGMVFGFGGGVLFGLFAGPWWGVTVGFFFAHIFGTRLVLSRNDHSAWPSYVVATYYLAWKRRLPRRLMAFLDDAHRVGLLRTVGPIYQFRHARLQDYLAQTYREQARPSRSAPTSGSIPQTLDQGV